MRALGLRALGGDRGDSELGQGASELGRRTPVDELLLERQRHPLGRLEDAMPIAVQREGDTVAADRVAQHDEVAGGVLLLPEGRPSDDPGGVVDRGDEGQARAALREPVVARAVGLEEHARLGRPVPAAAVARRSVAARGGDAGRPQDPPHADPAERDPLALGEQFGQVTVVGAVVPPAASARTRSGVGSSIRRGEARPRLPWTSPAGPAAMKRPLSRQTDRSDRPRSPPASAAVSSPAITFVTTHARRCSTVVIVIVSPHPGETDKVTDQLALTDLRINDRKLAER